MLHNIFFLLWIFLHTPTIHPGLFAVYIPSGGTFLPLPAPFPYILAEYTNIYVYMHVSMRRQKQRPKRAAAQCFLYTIFSGRTVSSNSSAVSKPRDRTASFKVVPSARAFFAHLAAAS